MGTADSQIIDSSSRSSIRNQAMRRKKLVLVGSVGTVILIAVVVGVLVSQRGTRSSSSSSSAAANQGLEESLQDTSTGSSTATPSTSLRPSASPSSQSSPGPTIRSSTILGRSAAPTTTSTTTVVPNSTADPESIQSGVPGETLSPSSSALPTDQIAVSDPPTATFASNSPTPSTTWRPPTGSPVPTGDQTMSLTVTPIDPDLRFRLKIHWEEDFFWQEESIERRFVVCSTCNRF